MLFVFGFASSWAADYELLLEDSDIFSPCTEPPPGSIGFHDAFDIGDLVVDQDMDIIHLSESVTLIWDVEPTDRISVMPAFLIRNKIINKQLLLRPGLQ